MEKKREDIINKTIFNGEVYGPINSGSGPQIVNNYCGNQLKFFDILWAKKNLDKVIQEAGSRYAPKFEGVEELNVKIPISELFDGIGITQRFWADFKTLYGEVKRTFEYDIVKVRDYFDKRYPSIEEIVEDIVSDVNVEKQMIFDFNEGSYYFRKNVKELRELRHTTNLSLKKEAELFGVWNKLHLTTTVEKILHMLNNAINLGFKVSELEEINFYISEIDFSLGGFLEINGYESREIEYNVQKVRRILSRLKDFITSKKVSLVNKPYMLLVGEALIGKTHLLCDIAKERLNSNLPTILILGQHLIGNEPPWIQIIKELGLNCTKEEFIEQLDCWSKRVSQRVIIMIDALNEGNGKSIWYDRLAGFLEDLKEYTTIGIVVSIRSSELSDTIRNDIIEKKLIRVEHPGFRGIEYEALKTYCKVFNLNMPKIAVINPSFLNPGFLYILCKGLRNKNLRDIPLGSKGLIYVFENYIESIHERIYVKNYLGYDKNINLVNRALNAIAMKMAEVNKTWIEYEESKKIVDELLPGREFDNSLFNALLSEGIINTDRYFDSEREFLIIRFSYQKLENYLIARYLLDTYLDNKNPNASFDENEKLGIIMKNRRSWPQYMMIIEAFFIMIPERVNKELFDLFPEIRKNEEMSEKFIESIIWRSSRTISDDTIKYINECIRSRKYVMHKFFDVLLTLASDIEHPYNADFLHKNLLNRKLAERDDFWTTFIHYEYGEKHSVDRLIDWALSNEDKSYVDNKSIRLCATAITWFLTSSNRFLRDRATKALVALLYERIDVLIELISNFLTVNDMYILERLFAVAYGCIMKSKDSKSIKNLAINIYNWIFKTGEPPIHILLREYARCAIEFAVYKKLELDIEIDKIRPPYKSKWISKLPSTKEFKAFDSWNKSMTEEEKQTRHLYHSIIGQSDFARYVIGTNSGFFDWTPKRLKGRRKQYKKDIYEKFISSLTEKQRKVWDSYIKYRHMVEDYIALTKAEKIKLTKVVYSKTQLKAELEKMRKSFIRTLGKSKQEIFRKHIIPYLNNPSKYRNEDKFDLSIIQRYIFKRVLELGWDAKLFGDFDSQVNRYSGGREAKKSERIGKKYQWIAYHEFLAMVSDNFEFLSDKWNKQIEKYDGSWQLSYRNIRDIDPSCIIKKIKDNSTDNNIFEVQYEYRNWNLEIEESEWLKDSLDLPEIEQFINISNTEDGSKWLTLEGFYKWMEDIPYEEDVYEKPRRELWYMIKSYIVRKEDVNEVYNWAIEQNFAGRWMPESHDQIDIFLGEFFWSPAFKHHNVPYYMHEGWTRGRDNIIPKEILVTTDKYLKEDNTFDCSVDEGMQITLPCNWIVENMNLHWTGREGCYSDEKENITVIDPTINCENSSILLINRELFLRFLDINGYEIIWTVLGEKSIIGGDSQEWAGRLEISGAYKLMDGEVRGDFIAQYRK